MPDTIPNLWPAEFKVDVQTPLTILKVQANLLSKVTRGLLQGTVETESGERMTQHRLVVIAPAYNGYRHTLLVAKHRLSRPYPVTLKAIGLEKIVSEVDQEFDGEVFERTVYPRASGDEEFQALVHKALQSDYTRALINSLIAQTNEAKSTSGG